AAMGLRESVRRRLHIEGLFLLLARMPGLPAAPVAAGFEGWCASLPSRAYAVELRPEWHADWPALRRLHGRLARARARAWRAAQRARRADGRRAGDRGGDRRSGAGTR